MKIVFFGSDDFAVTNLKRLLSSDQQVVACVTQPDRPKGRHLKLTPSPVKALAVQHKVSVLEPTNLKDKDFLEQLKGFNADLFVVIAYGRILPEAVLILPKLFCINIHGSLLPKYRGAAPINWAIINGDQTTGVTAIKMNTGMDAGEIIAQEKISIEPDDNSVTLRVKMADLSAEFLIRVINTLVEGQYSLNKQNEKDVSYAAKLDRKLGLIDWNKKAADIYNLVRGLQPWPCAYTFFNNKMLKILNSEVQDQKSGVASPGEVVGISKEGISVATLDGLLLLKEVHLQDSKPMDAVSFVAGHKLETGFLFGSSKS